MLFCIDIGNTNMVLGVIHNGRVLDHWRVRTEKEITADEMRVLVGNLFATSRIDLGQITDIIVSCVVPPLLKEVEDFSSRYFNVRPMIIGPKLETGMPIIFDNPKEVGADRIVNAVAAYEKYRSGLIVVDFGTATTFDCVSKDGAFLGGAIVPGIVISCEALFQKASKLPRVEIFAKPKTVIAKDTISSMNSGLVFGYVGLVDGLVRRIIDEVQVKPKVIATGGLAVLIASMSDTIDEVSPDLTIDGLRIIFERNRQPV